MDSAYLNRLYSQVAKELDISETLFERATTSYDALGDYLNSKLSDYQASIYAQGSFNLGTVIKPLTDEDDYDLDLVCEIENGEDLSAYGTKHVVGNILSTSTRYSNKLEEKNRCWRIDYADEAQFHMDITPSIPDNNIVDAIHVTDRLDKNFYEFSPSNPKGYGKWFYNQMEVKYKQLLEQYAFSSNVSDIEKVPKHKVKTPLQQAIQILKRHRDISFQNNREDAPISIIITTLAAKSYTNIDGVYDTLKVIIKSMPSYIEKRNDILWVENPTNQAENFAEKWNDEPTKASAFYSWINKAKNELIDNPLTLLNEQFNESLENSLGQAIMERSFAAIEAPSVVLESQAFSATYQEPVITALGVPHRQKPYWKGMPHGYTLWIDANVKDSSGLTYQYRNNGVPIKKQSRIKFRILGSTTIIKPPYKVVWQITNTGAEAQENGCLRGDFHHPDSNVSDWVEPTAYTGIHFVQAFLFKRNRCIARSKEFIVNIE